METGIGNTPVSAVTLEAFLAEIDGLRKAATAALEAATNDVAVEAARVEYLGARSGRLKAIQKLLGGLSAADKPAAGKGKKAVAST